MATPKTRRRPLAVLLCALLASTLATAAEGAVSPRRATAQGVGSDGQEAQLFEGTGHFSNGDTACGGPAELDDAFRIGISEQPDRTLLFLQRKSVGQTTTFQVGPDGTLSQTGGTSETYEDGRLEGRAVTARYARISGSCTERWDLVVTIPDLVVGEIVTSTSSTLFDVERALRERGRAHPSSSSDGTPVWPLFLLVGLGAGAILLARRRGGGEDDAGQP